LLPAICKGPLDERQGRGRECGRVTESNLSRGYKSSCQFARNQGEPRLYVRDLSEEPPVCGCAGSFASCIAPSRLLCLLSGQRVALLCVVEATCSAVRCQANSAGASGLLLSPRVEKAREGRRACSTAAFACERGGELAALSQPLHAACRLDFLSLPAGAAALSLLSRARRLAGEHSTHGSMGRLLLTHVPPEPPPLRSSLP